MNRVEREEAMELVGTRAERGPITVADLASESLHHPLTRQQIETLEEDKLIVVDAQDRVNMTAEGQRLADQIIRRHRLAERLMVDVLVFKHVDSLEESACDLEHVMTEELADSICTLLGHPRSCPHGRPIPRGACCSEKRTRVQSLICALTELETGEMGRIAYISTEDHYRLDQLSSMGLFPGTEVTIHQKQPALVILFDETTLALDEEIAGEIRVWKQ